ncbi:MAG TPA: hypothetical protein PLX15_05045 [Candidatus Woesearchaeota archaeon]|nr:hypothetical protein [Candidatus Woesearchaeota archaeon]
MIAKIRSKFLFFCYVVLFLGLIYLFWNKGIFERIKDMNVTFVLLFLSGCLIAGFAPRIISKKLGIKDEISDELTLKLNSIKKNENSVLYGFFLLGLVLLIFRFLDKDLFLKYELLIFLIGLLFLFLIDFYLINASFSENFKFKSKIEIQKRSYFIRYLLEIPKLLFIFLGMNIGLNIGIILITIGLGSIFYSLLPRGIFILDLLVLSLFALSGYSFIDFLVFTLFSRFIGASFIIIVYFVARFILSGLFPNSLEKWQSQDRL